MYLYAIAQLPPLPCRPHKTREFTGLSPTSRPSPHFYPGGVPTHRSFANGPLFRGSAVCGDGVVTLSEVEREDVLVRVFGQDVEPLAGFVLGNSE